MAPPKPAYRPGRYLAVLVLILAGLFTLIQVKHWTPRLGLDLQGGTSVTLTPDSTKNPGGVDDGKLQKAVDIIRLRVDAFGVGESEVVTQGGNIVISLPSVGRDEAISIVGRTAQLTFRGVIGQPVPNAPSLEEPSPSATGTPTATASAGPSRPASPTPSNRPTQTANPRVMPQAQPTVSATPKASASATAAATASASASPSAAPGADVTTEDLLALDCNDKQQAAQIAAKDDPAVPIVACSRDGQFKYLLGAAEVVGSDVKDAEATIAGEAGDWQVRLLMTDKGKTAFAKATQTHKGQFLAIVLDGVVQSAPTVNEEITNGEAVISGSFTSREARDLANVLKYGALPVVFEQSQVQTISPTLGRDALDGGVKAGLLGVFLVILLLLSVYRGLGIVSIIGMSLFAAFSFALVVFLGDQIGFTLTLAGIAGLIISVGITADSYIVFFERIKDEVRGGRALRASVDRSFKAAFRTILAADSVSFLAAAVLYVVSVGAVRGFAFTLGLSTLLDVFLALFFTRPTVTLLARRKFFAEGRFVGIKDAVAGGPTPKEA